MVELRFPLGARVECSVGGAWAPGTIVQHHYTQPDMPAGTSVPYQVALDDGRLIFARRDADAVIRTLVREAEPVPSIFPQPENRAAVLRSLVRALVQVASAFLLMQAAEFAATGHVPLRMSFINAEMVVDGRLSIDGYGVAALAAAFAILGLQLQAHL